MPEGTCVHVCTASLPRHSLLQLAKGVYVAAPELALAQASIGTASFIELLQLAWEACGSYQTERTGPNSAYNLAPITSTSAIRSFVAHGSSVGGSQNMARALPYLADNSASSRETKLALALGLPHRYGGYGLGIPQMNRTVRTDAAVRRSSGRASFRCDLSWPAAKVDVEYQSRENHSSELSRLRDSRRTNGLASLGWTVVQVTNDELDSPAALDTVARTIRLKLGKRARVSVEDYAARKLNLRRQLGLRTEFC